MPAPDPMQRIRVAVTYGTPLSPFARLLQHQREEEPETPVTLSEATSAELAAGMADGRYDVGLALAPSQGAALKSYVLWQEELAVAVPLRSPLLAHAHIPLQDVAEYPLVMWCPERCETLNDQLTELLHGVCERLDVVQYVHSFELMAVLVAAGYGVCLAGRSSLAAARDLNLVMRPLAGTPCQLTTYMLCPDPVPPSIERFAQRAAAIQWRG